MMPSTSSKYLGRGVASHATQSPEKSVCDVFGDEMLRRQLDSM